MKTKNTLSIDIVVKPHAKIKMANIQNNKRCLISGLLLRNKIIRENIKYRSKIYDDFIKNINKKDEFRKIAQDNLNIEITNFINKI